MLVNQREQLRKEGNGSSGRRCLAPADRHGLAAWCEIKIADPKRLSFRDTNAGVPQEPDHDAMPVGALRVEQCAVFVWPEVVVRTLLARRRVNCPHRVASCGPIGPDEKLRLLEIGEEHAERPNRPPQRRWTREITVTVLEPCFPLRQEQLEVRSGEIADTTAPEPILKASEGVPILTPCRGGAATPAKVAVKALEKLLGTGPVFDINTH